MSFFNGAALLVASASFQLLELPSDETRKTLNDLLMCIRPAAK
jgi:hypothetical protein